MTSIKSWLKTKGPGALITAAFIGPGTVTTCTIAGASFGFELLWAMVLAIIATYVLQEMAVRMAIVTQKSLPEIIRSQVSSLVSRRLVLALILLAILIGNGAYEAGNISGAALGLMSVLPISPKIAPLIVGILAFGILWIGNYKWMERILVSMVILMSICFVTAAIYSRPQLGPLIGGLFIPRLPDGSIYTVVALIGTTVVPYNLFLHASLGLEKWKNPTDIKYARSDAAIAIVAGGLISMAIIITAAASGIGNSVGFLELAKGLENTFGNLAKPMLGLGLLAAGLTSAITAPLAAAYVTKSCLEWNEGIRDRKFRMVWASIILVGTLFSSLGIKPLQIISFAQLANGLMLPIIAVIIIRLTSKKEIMGQYVNTPWQKALSFIIIGVTIVLGIMSIGKGLGIF